MEKGYKSTDTPVSPEQQEILGAKEAVKTALIEYLKGALVSEYGGQYRDVRFPITESELQVQRRTELNKALKILGIDEIPPVKSR